MFMFGFGLVHLPFRISYPVMMPPGREHSLTWWIQKTGPCWVDQQYPVQNTGIVSHRLSRVLGARRKAQADAGLTYLWKHTLGHISYMPQTFVGFSGILTRNSGFLVFSVWDCTANR
jgi:hypothetical protein